MNKRLINIAAIVSTFFIFGMNLYQAGSYYHIDRIHLSNYFYLQSVGDFLVDNKVEKRQTYGVGFSTTFQLILDTAQKKIVIEVKKDSFRADW